MSLRTNTDQVDLLYLTTWKKYFPNAVDNIFKGSPLFVHMKNKGAVKGMGGTHIEHLIEYGDHEATEATVDSTGDVAASITAAAAVEMLTSVRYEWGHKLVSIVRKYKEDSLNSAEKILEIAKQRLSNAENSLYSIIERTIFNPYSADAQAVIGLRHLIRDVPNPIAGPYKVGEIPQGDGANLWWNNQSFDAAGRDPALNFLTDLGTLFDRCSLSQGVDTPTMIVTSQKVHALYEQLVTPFKVLLKNDKGDVSFETLSFRGIPITWVANCPDDKLYMLNFNYLYLFYHSEVFMQMLPWIWINNSVNRRTHISSYYNFAVTNRARQGVMFNIQVP